MDKTLEIIIAVTVLLLTAVTVMVLMGDRAGKFGQWANDTQQGASCDLYKTQYKTACECGAETNYRNQETRELSSKAQSEGCEWSSAGSNFDCQVVCQN